MSFDVEFVKDLSRVRVNKVVDLPNPDLDNKLFTWASSSEAVRSMDFQRCIGIAMLGVESDGVVSKFVFHATPGAFTEFSDPEFARIISELRMSTNLTDAVMFGGVKRQRFENPYDLMRSRTVLLMRNLGIPLKVVPPRTSDGKLDMLLKDKLYLKVD